MAARTTVMHDDLGLLTGPPAAALFSTLEAVLAEAGSSTPARVVVANVLAASTSLSVPANLTLEFVGQGALDVAAGVVVTILGHVLAPARQIFTGSGTVVFGRDDAVVYPGWWGSGSGVRIGKLASDSLAAALVQATSLQADTASLGAVQATSVQTTGSIIAGNQVRAVEVYEGSMRVGTDRVARAGDTMTGPLYLYAMPEGALEAASRGYVLEVFAALQSAVEQTDGFGILVIDNASTIKAASPMDVISLVSGFGMKLAKGAPLALVDDTDPVEFYFVDDDADAVDIVDENALVLSCAESPATAVLAATDSIPSGKRLVRVSGSGGAVDLTSAPQVVAGSFDGQPLDVVGDDDTNTVKLDQGSGLALAGGASVTLGKGDCLSLRWDAADATWREQFRASV